ncbi:MAG: hypothetical protein HY002_11985 [Candidatus Rokubacteria bacterium]|nr:hypothetical protein [Candidatus Rokubacteria bacterium]
MYEILLADASFFEFLLCCDRDLAEEARMRGCLICKGVVHRADYERRPRGEPRGLSEEFARRHSFCCARQGCRKRVTPPSLRFLGRRLYLGAVVVLVAAMREGPTPTRLERLQEMLGVCARTVRRWQQWWRETFPQTAVWVTIRGQLAQPVETGRLPGSLLERLLATGTLRERVVALLRLLAPLSCRSPADRII